MTLLQLKYISTVAKCGSFSKAAQALYVSQPGISKMVCALEEELGITIFVRSAAGITLTAEGRELLNMGERLLTDAEHISQHFSQDLSKTHETLSVSSQHYCFAIDAMMAYQNTYQKESYTYKFLVGQGPEVIQQVVDKTTELGVLFISSRSRKHMNRVFGDNNLEFHPLFDSKPYVFIHKSHPLASKEVLTIEELHPYPCIMYELDSDAPSVLQEEMLVPDFYPQKVTIVNGLYQSLMVMQQCQGYDLGTGFISESNGAQGVIKRPIKGFDDPITIGWVCQKAHTLSQPAERFIQLLQKYGRDLPEASLYTNNSNFSKLKQVVPDETYFLLQEIHQTQDLPHLDYLFTNLISKLRLAKLDELTKIYGIREGLEYKLLKTANEAINLQDFFQKLKSKRYPLTNLQRLTLYLLLNITKDLIQRFDDTGALYARVLAFNDKGTELLKQMKKNASIPIITKTTSYLDSKKRCQQKLTTFEEMLAIDTYATELYNLCFNPFKPYGKDFTTSPYYFKTNNEN